MTSPENSADSIASTTCCPDCGAMQATRVSLFGMFLFTAGYRCDACGREFERIKIGSDLETADGDPERSSK